MHGLGQMGAAVWLARLYASRLSLADSGVGLMISTNILGLILGRIIWTSFGGFLPTESYLVVALALGPFSTY